MIGYAKSVKDNVQPCTREQLHSAFDSPRVAEVCQAIAEALAKHRQGGMTKDEYEAVKSLMKKQLPILTLHAIFKNGRRKNDEAIPSGLSMYDLDDIANPRAKWAEIEPRKEELGIVLAHVTPSGEGLRLAFRVPQGMTLAEAQAWMASQLGDAQYDSCVKDYARCSFVVPRAYILYVDESGLLASCSPQSDTESHRVLNNPADDEKEKNSVELCELRGVKEDLLYPEAYEEIPYKLLVEILEEQMGGAPEHGNRNNFIFSMACHLRYVCNDDARWIAHVLPNYGEAEDKWMATIKSACARNQNKQMPKIMQRTVLICKERLGLNTEKGDALTPPEMPKRLPALIKLLVSRTPKIYQPAVAHAIFPALATHLWKTTFRYIDNVEHEATLMNVLMAGTGAGKNCISEPINRIMADIRERDRINLAREREWKREMQTKGAN
ncbi:MAG: VirE protein, partial [Bacteroidaceae bacterium]|nr:VirE protein [Bacteroidaceae bacterium]